MKRINYKNGSWSERNGNKLEWGTKKGLIKMCKTFNKTDQIIDDLPTTMHKYVTIQGYDPSHFFAIKNRKGEIKRYSKALKTEITECIQFAVEAGKTDLQKKRKEIR